MSILQYRIRMLIAMFCIGQLLFSLWFYPKISELQRQNELLQKQNRALQITNESCTAAIKLAKLGIPDSGGLQD